MAFQTTLFQSDIFEKWDFFRDYRDNREMQDLLNLADKTLRCIDLPKLGEVESASPMFPKSIDKQDFKNPNIILEQLAALIRMADEGRTEDLLQFNQKLILWHYLVGGTHLGVVTFFWDAETRSKTIVVHELTEKVSRFWIWTFPFKYHRF